MAIKVKQGDTWHRINTQSKVSTLSFEISKDSWIENVGEQNFTTSISILGMTSKYSALILFDNNQNGMKITAKCEDDNLVFTIEELPEVVLKGSIIYFNSDSQVSIYYFGGLTDENAELIAQKVEEKLPIVIDDQGYSQIQNIRQVTQAAFKREDNKVTVSYTLQGGKLLEDVINLDDSGRPASGMVNGVEWNIEWEGF